MKVVEANIAGDCLGCGYCNMGCPFGKKQSMLDTVLPWAQSDCPTGASTCCPASAPRGSSTSAGGRSAVAGEHGGREVVLPAAEKVVVSAGAVGSSWLLQRSGIGGEQVGARAATSTSTRR